MSLITDTIFVKALRSNPTLLAKLAAGDVYNTTIPVPDEELDNVPVPYVIVAFNGLTNADQTKDSLYEGPTDRVQISIEVVAQTRPQLGELVSDIRQTVREYFVNATTEDEDYHLIPLDYDFSAERVIYDDLKPAYGQTLNYQCEVNADDYEQEENGSES